MENVMRIASETTQKSLPKRINFTVAALQAASCPAGKGRTWLYDTRTPGLACMVTESNVRTFYVYKKVQGRPQRVRLGGFPSVSIEQARKLSANVTARIAGGGDPQSEKRMARAMMTLGALWEWLPDEGLNHDPYAYLKSERSATNLVNAPLNRIVQLQGRDSQ